MTAYAQNEKAEAPEHARPSAQQADLIQAMQQRERASEPTRYRQFYYENEKNTQLPEQILAIQNEYL